MLRGCSNQQLVKVRFYSPFNNFTAPISQSFITLRHRLGEKKLQQNTGWQDCGQEEKRYFKVTLPHTRTIIKL